ncbi:hypothetical protein Tco_1378537 [Tanacetum coccineum]
MAQYGSRHRHLGQQVLDAHKDEGRLPETIRFTGTIGNTPLEMRKYSHEFYHKLAKDNKLLLHDLGNRDHQKNYADILAEFGTIAYQLELPDQLSRAQSTFHISNLEKKCLSDETLAIPLDEIQINGKLHFIKEPVEIIDREVKHLK